MRETSTRAVDIAVVVVAADDGVMPQTVEAVDHARAADRRRRDQERGPDLRADADAPAEGVVVDTVVDARHGGTCCDVLVTWGGSTPATSSPPGGHYGRRAAGRRSTAADERTARSVAAAAAACDAKVAEVAAAREIRRLRAVAEAATLRRRCHEVVRWSFDRKRDGTFGSSVVDGDDEAAAAGPWPCRPSSSSGDAAAAAAPPTALPAGGVRVLRDGAVAHVDARGVRTPAGSGDDVAEVPKGLSAASGSTTRPRRRLQRATSRRVRRKAAGSD
ncbi:hypothetical protein JL720_10019 [Aureococcus anophagefferens]|nr:hypothetical protein JL720_10019 [Aureococcus anophagefferens]